MQRLWSRRKGTMDREPSGRIRRRAPALADDAPLLRRRQRLGQGTSEGWAVYVAKCSDGSTKVGCTRKLSSRIVSLGFERRPGIDNVWLHWAGRISDEAKALDFEKAVHARIALTSKPIRGREWYEILPSEAVLLILTMADERGLAIERDAHIGID